jgi:hypothetical protein
VAVEDVIEENNLLAKADRQVHGHRHSGNHEITLIHLTNKLLQWKVA